ncbi:hypothetical protein AMTR_s00155p00049720 [Amborella trichopoda]|uniref:Uncharacterized protein n=1 Tax=Amborella trichopoda TaxID=13333 RepID=W1PI54_AMBTC|nr:hypothetical protein AMTR_s00155p00049720 [Amborella trichopoda]
MGDDSPVKVDILSDTQSCSLFFKAAGIRNPSPSIHHHAEIIFRWCTGLPLAISTVARAMAGRQTEGAWKNAIRKLEELASTLDGLVDELGSLEATRNEVDCLIDRGMCMLENGDELGRVRMNDVMRCDAGLRSVDHLARLKGRP